MAASQRFGAGLPLFTTTGSSARCTSRSRQNKIHQARTAAAPAQDRAVHRPGFFRQDHAIPVLVAEHQQPEHGQDRQLLRLAEGVAGGHQPHRHRDAEFANRFHYFSFLNNRGYIVFGREEMNGWDFAWREGRERAGLQ